MASESAPVGHEASETLNLSRAEGMARHCARLTCEEAFTHAFFPTARHAGCRKTAFVWAAMRGPSQSTQV